jgi:hypothetical protein
MRAPSRRLLISLLSGVSVLPFAAQAAPPTNDELLRRIDSLSQEIEQLKAQVKASDDKTVKAAKTDADAIDDLKDQLRAVDRTNIGKWLTIGGDYRFRVDSLRGETAPFTDVVKTFGNAQNALQADFFGNPTGVSRYFGAPQAGGMSTAGALSALMGFSQAMNGVQTYSQAAAFLGNPMNAGLVRGLGSFAATIPSYNPRIDTLYTNRFGIDLHAKATQDVTITARLLMYKVFGAQDDQAVANDGSAPFFADRVGVFDGTLGHVPSSGFLAVDRAYATWSNIGDEPVWFSVGRRPTTYGAPSNLRLNAPRPGNGGTPAILVDYAFDGMTLGYAPDVESLPGAYAKLCYGRGFQSSFESPTNSLSNTDMVGVSVVPIDSDPLRVWAMWDHAFNIFDAPTMSNTYFGNTAPKTQLGDIDWAGAGALSTIKKVGPGDLNFFADAASSFSHPNHNVSAQFGFQGLLTGGFFSPEAPTDKTGWATYLGVRYDLPTLTKLGFEYNHGSKNWITFTPAADDIWTSKLGTRGNVYEAYVIQELPLKPISSYFFKAFFRAGFQYYDFQYTGSNNWVGAPVKMSQVNGQLMTLTPLKNAYDIYGTFEVHF